MTGEFLLDAFLNANLLFCIGYLLWWVVSKSMSFAGLRNTHAVQLSLLTGVFVVVFAAPLIAFGVSAIQGAGVAGGVKMNLSDLVVSHYLNGGFDMKASNLEGLILARESLILNVLTASGWLAKMLIALFLIGVLAGSLRLVLSVMCLHRIVHTSYVWRHFGSIRLLVSDRTLVPFSTRSLFNYYVVLPSHMLGQPDEMRVSLAHEFQHIRQRDLEWEVLLEALKPLFFFNPAFHACKRQVEALREFKCDAAVLSRGVVDARSYCDTLLSVCQKTLRQGQGFAVAVPKVPLVNPNADAGTGTSLVEHRIVSALEPRNSTGHRFLVLMVGVPMLVAVSFASVAIQRPGDWSQDRLTLSTVVNLERLDEINRLATFGRTGN